ncbi:amiloride-sensitive sodium channel subunit beta-like [Physella acuta]|uniref:amiloride-sensitive sodium channel subunit beta-like n=1 Tax=Physella acuta TaxID=109671 RepID=UPI0027DBD78B|nr:amiloride-sensitive sodium channel subunit beta-like [Physella acuta]
MVISIGAMLFHLYILFDRYFQYKTNTQVELKFSRIQFPDVTVCNNNVLRKSKWRSGSKQVRFILQNVYDECDQTDDSNSTTDLNNVGDYTCITETEADLEAFEISAQSQDPADISGFASLLKYTFKDVFSAQSESLKKDLGHQEKPFLLSCKFAQRQCKLDQYVSVLSPNYGNCYTIHNPKFVSTTSGPPGGLELVLFLENFEYLPYLTSGQGAVVVIHEPGTVPNIDGEGIFVSAGTQTLIGLKQVVFNRLGPPYSVCQQDDSYRDTYNITYRKNICQKLCLQEQIHQNCKCYDSASPQENSIMRVASRLHACRSAEELICKFKTTSEFSENEILCDCPNPCSETANSRSSAFLQWPSEDDIQELLHGYMSTVTDQDYYIKVYSIPFANLTNYFIKLVIYYDDLNYEIITEVPEYELFQLLSDVGGTIGLWIGLSLLSLFEVLQLLAEVVMFTVTHTFNL